MENSIFEEIIFFDDHMAFRYIDNKVNLSLPAEANSNHKNHGKESNSEKGSEKSYKTNRKEKSS